MEKQIFKTIKTLYQKNYFDNNVDFLIELLFSEGAKLSYILNDDMCEIHISSLKDEKHFTEFSLPKFLVENISDMKYYFYIQDGHYIVTDENVAKIVVIEAENITEAEQKAIVIGIYFNGVEKGIDCGCGCGDRWYRLNEDDNISKIIEFPHVEFNPYRDSIEGFYSNNNYYLFSNIQEYLKYLFYDFPKVDTPRLYFYSKDNKKYTY